MWRVKYQHVTVILSGETMARLKEGTPFSDKRVPDHAIEMLRIALFKLFPPKTPDEWKDLSRYQGFLKPHWHFWFDLACHKMSNLIGRKTSLDWYARNDVEPTGQLTLQVPLGLMKWVEEISRSKRVTISEAAAYAIEYAYREVMPKKRARNTDRGRHNWRSVLRYVWGRN